MIQSSIERIYRMYLGEIDGIDRKYWSLFQSTHNIEDTSLDTSKTKPDKIKPTNQINRTTTNKPPQASYWKCNSLLTLNHLRWF